MLGKGQTAPDFSLRDLDGKEWSLSGALRGGPVLLVFFKISCPTCQFTLPFLGRLGAGQPIAISQDDAAGTLQFHKRFGLAMRTLLDPGRTFAVSNLYRIASVPSLFSIEPDGAISMAVEGFSKAHLERLAARWAVPMFGPGETVPAMRPG